jgi:hypothetical protein
MSSVAEAVDLPERISGLSVPVAPQPEPDGFLRARADVLNRLASVDDDAEVAGFGHLQVGQPASLEFLDPLLAFSFPHEFGGGVEYEHQVRFGTHFTNQPCGDSSTVVEVFGLS